MFSANGARCPGGRAFLGGSFNPPHIGHFRLAIEIREALGDRISVLSLLPCANPPHKEAAGLLPFELRARMVESVTRRLPGIDCDRCESLRRGPSYTWDTLRALRDAHPDEALFFILGSQDFEMLDSWYYGSRLPELCHLIVVPRARAADAVVAATVRRLWPEAAAIPPLFPDGVSFHICGPTSGQERQTFGLVHFLHIPWLPISASDIRRRWLAGLNTDFLLPETVADILHEQASEVLKHWQTTEHKHADNATQRTA